MPPEQSPGLDYGLASQMPLGQHKNKLLSLLHSLARPASEHAGDLFMGKYDTLMDTNIMQGQRARAWKYNVMYRRNVQVCDSALRPTKSDTRFLLTCCRPSNALPAQALTREHVPAENMAKR